jgi:periplasmic divalent cation tolerance protein
MKIIYVTLSNAEEANKIGRELLEKQLCNCVNYFPITCMYNYENEITEEPEVVLIIKTKDSKYDDIRNVIKSHIDYDNFIGQFGVEKINDDFQKWLDDVVK